MQRAFDAWREVYNFERPHEAHRSDVPAQRYRPSLRPMPRKLPNIEYGEYEIVRIVPSTKDYISFKGRALESPASLPRRTRRNQAQSQGWTLRRLLRLPSDRNYRLDQTENVSHVSEQVSAMSPD